MNKNREILLKIVRVAMGWETDFSLPRDVDWKEVFVLAQEQGVNAIALDGLEVLMQKKPEAMQTAEAKQILLESIGNLQMTESHNLNQLSALLKLSDILSKKDIPFMIMKGFACAKNYPNPKHRPCGDIDIYPGERFDESNQALRDAGFEVDPYYYRHSAVMINNIMIENHKVLGDLRGPKRQTKELEELLQREAQKSIQNGKKAKVMDTDIPGAVFPSANFNALFLPWHVSAHFMVERVTLRHLLDWALFLAHDGNSIDLELYRHAKKNFTFGYCKMVDILTNLSLRYLNMPVNGVPTVIIDDARSIDIVLADRVFEYMFVGQPKDRGSNVWQERINNLKRIWKERWKYKAIYNQSFMSLIMYKMTGVLFKIGEN